MLRSIDKRDERACLTTAVTARELSLATTCIWRPQFRATSRLRSTAGEEARTNVGTPSNWLLSPPPTRTLKASFTEWRRDAASSPTSER